MENVNESVTQPDVNSVQTENQNELNNSVNSDYKRDMFRFKQEAKELRERLKEIELKDEQKKGNFETVISKLKEDLNNEKKRNVELQKTFATQRLDDAIKTKAIEKGLKGTQLDAFIRLIDNNDKGIVEFDERFNVKQEDVDSLVDGHLKRYGEIFSRKVNVVDSAPNNNSINNSKPAFDMNKASSAEIIEYLKANKDKLK